MLFSPDSCSVIQTPKNKIQLIAQYQDGHQKRSDSSLKIPFVSPTDTVEGHKINFKGNEILLNKEKYLIRVIQFTRCSYKLATILQKTLLNIDNDSSLTNFVNHTICLNHWKNRITHIIQNHEPQNTESYHCAINFRRFLKEYIDQFGHLNPDLNTFVQEYKENELTPLILKIHRVLYNTIRSLTINAAAGKGKAFTLGVNAMATLEQEKFLALPMDCPNHILLLRKLDCVFKQGNPSNREEERTIESLFNLSMTNGLVNSMQLSALGSHHYGNRTLTREQYHRAHAICACTPLVREAIARRLKDEDQFNLWKKIESNYKNRDLLTRYYSHYANINYFVHLDNKTQIMNFETFKRFLNSGRFTASTPIRSTETSRFQSMDQFLSDPCFRKVLDYEKNINMKARSLFLPVFASEDLKTAYEKVEKLKWEYLQDDVWIPVTFKELQVLWLMGIINIYTKVCLEDAIDSKNIGDTDNRLLECLNVQWIIHFPEIKIEYPDFLESYSNPTARPYIHQMILFSDMDHEKPSFIQMLDRLDDNSILRTLLTAEFQFLDLHLNNLGVTIQVEEKYKYLFPLEYETELGKGNYTKLVIDYLDGDLSENNKISVRLDPEHQFAELPETCKKGLFASMESNWQLELFDTEYTMGETNIIHGFCMDYNKPHQQKGHLIPFRSDLLATRWRDKPLPIWVIKRWMDPQRLIRIRNWVNRRDAPIKRLLPAHFVKGLEIKIDEYLNSPEFSLSQYTAKNKNTSIERLSNAFAEKLCDLKKFEIFWIVLNKTLEKVSKGYFKDLLDNAEKRFRIAKQLFPRLTYFQRQALFDRQNRVLRYLNLYEQMNESTDAAQKMVLLEQLLNNTCTPFSYLDSKKHLAKLDEIKCNYSEEHLNIFFDYIKGKLVPTYFNVVKSMYPLLADTCRLAEHFFPNLNDSGRRIGEYLTPMNVLIGRAKLEENEEVRETALYLEQEIIEADKEFKAYFGNFVTKPRKEETK